MEERLQDLTDLQTVDAQAGVRGVVQPSLLSPATGGVCVHLPGCDPCIIKAVKHIDNKNTF